VHTEICDRLDIEFPIFAFTHCRDVVAAVSNAGGFGVLGAIGFSADELEIELEWLDAHVGDHGYGVDIVIPGKYEGMGELDPKKLEAQLQAMVPEDHRRFARRLMEEHGIPEPPEDERRSGMMGWTEATAKPLLECALRHPKVRLIANALGTPPADVIEQVHSHGLLFAALAGSVKHAKHHAEAGIDIVICQGTEGGGHTGEIGSIVLWPEVIQAIAPTPVLAAGGIGTGGQVAAALALGAQGVWSGTLWLTVEEADTAPVQIEAYLAASSSDTIRSRSYTGKPCRMLKNDWTEAWARDDTPDPLPMPMQMLVAIEAVGSAHRHPAQSKGVAFNPCGQIVGRATSVRKARDVVMQLVEEYIEAVERLTDLAAKV
jgi:NAD(P)H-dependent flavin oxidoreductase YrpB (nitropropane dioxygenase family)